MADIRLVVATIELLEALRDNRAAFGSLIGSEVPDGWPEFPESVEFTITKLTESPDEAQWWMHFFVLDGDLVGSGGFVGPPDGGVVEIGYEIAPAFRGRGLATGAARAMIDKATATGSVSTVIAHTLAHENPSTGVLRRLGFTVTGEDEDPDEGTVWRWELPVNP
jgi:RimJ/RimL family protein N-acetyltransferase